MLTLPCMTKLLAAVALALAGGAVAACAPPPSYVANVRYDGDQLVVDRCQFDYRGRPTTDCREESVDGGGPQFSPPPDPADIDAAGRAAAARPERRAAPDEAAVARALASPGVHRAVELCRAQFAPDLASFSFTLAVAPTGTIAVTPHDAAAPTAFSDCASSAIHGANLTAYDGAPVSFEQQLAL